ncbi:thioesterase [Alloactinosynnema sp. L-07]|uniref:thioesterase II family protein n=1 Tax=Alloactinosynnema sp. L-07 TaxID=1653480 RepID=UPI00065EF127|nr:alpha/beta fold hydrolase [Alloactinosynnema sp. L-07]CRK59438.1 thioesterase [Alloactinosynnema sp. L-07]
MRRKWTSTVRPARTLATRRAVILPHAGAGPNALSGMWECLPADFEIVGVTLPGRERRFGESAKAVLGDPDTIVAEIVDELAAAAPRPTVVFGHSLGAAMAVAVVAAAPTLFDAMVLSSYPGEGTAAERAGRWDRAKLMRVIEVAGGTPAEVVRNPGWRDFLLELLRCDLTLGARMASIPFPTSLDLPVTVLDGAHDRLRYPTHRATWVTRLGAGVRTESLPGGHFYLLDEGARQAVAAEIAAVVEIGAAAA